MLFASNLHFLSSEALSAFGPCMPLPAAVWGRGPAPAPGGRRGGKSPGQLVWSRTPQNQQPSLFYPLHPWQTFALQLSWDASQHLTPTLLSRNANQGPHSPVLWRWRRKKVEKRHTGNERDGEWRSRKGGAGVAPWEPQGKARVFGKDKQEDRTLSLLIFTSRDHWLVFS